MARVFSSGMKQIVLLMAFPLILMVVVGLRNCLNFETSVAPMTMTKAAVKLAYKELSRFKESCARLPTSEEGLSILIKGGEVDCFSPVLEKPINDSWDKPLVYISSETSAKVGSYGQDGKPGGTGHNSDIFSESIPR